MGAGEGIYAPSGTALIADYFPRNKRATAISIFMSAMLIGGALAIIVAGIILKKTDKFDLERMAKLTPYSQGEQAGDCVYNGLHQTKHRLVSFDFDCGGEPLSVVLSNIDKKHEADARTILFNVDYRAGEAEPEGSLLEFASSFTDIVRDREDDDLQLVTAELKQLPSHFKLPAQYEGKLVFDEKAGLLAYKGIMTKDDLKALRDISDMPEYQKAVISISNEANFYFRRSDNWKWIFWILGPPGLIFALMAFMLREPVKGGTEDYLTESQAAAINAKGKIDYSPLWKTPSLVIMVFSNVIFTAAIGGLNMWLFPFVERYKGMESSEAAMKIGPIVVVAMLVGVVLSGIVSDMMFKKNKRAYNWIIFVCILAGIPFIYVFIMSDNYLAIVGAIAVGMFLLSWVNGPQNTLLVSVVDP
ncbi:MAG TPA: MFS transporter, partial [bacterium]|nr:MFS transporter [bacterium]